MISNSENFKIKWNYENRLCENGKGKDFLDFAQNYNIDRKNSKRRSINIIVKIKTIPGGHLFIIICHFIGKSFLFYWAEWLSNSTNCNNLRIDKLIHLGKLMLKNFFPPVDIIIIYNNKLFSILLNNNELSLRLL
jgi:hypothetical protein